MKTQILAACILASVSVACQPLGRGTSGANNSDSGTAWGSGTPAAGLARTGPYSRSGMPDVSIAASRADASLDVSGAGMAELSRRSQAAGLPQTAPAPAAPALTITPTTTTPDTDAILLDRVRLAFSSPNGPDQNATPLSIETLHNVQVNSHNRVITLTGQVGSAQERQEIERLAWDVQGVREVRNQLQIAPKVAP